MTTTILTSTLILARIRRKRRAAAGARSDLRSLIVEARHEGFTPEEIGRAAGLTPQRVSQIANEIRPPCTATTTPTSGSVA